ncbi:30S ribosomal protein S14 [Candidatus Tremblaya princeps]|uniref:Small ribosomal subunit protein uS14 n=1 Tax=Tremblaya princeps TaxID=189385 RepID=A0A143WR12_TREPR|nr:30S ribosomal protein S14 [Candidatus Tremblaya princeps]
MSKLSVLERERKRSALRLKFLSLRRLMLALLRSIAVTDDDKRTVRDRLHGLPRDSSPVRRRNRCHVTGRGRGYLRLFGLSRICARDMAARGEIPGVTKASW